MYDNWNCITNSTLISGIYGVGKAAVNPPALVVLSHTPPKATTTIAWVGKGIVYDTGGLSLKTKVHEHVFVWACTLSLLLIACNIIAKISTL